MSEIAIRVLNTLKMIDERTGVAELDRASQDILRVITIARALNDTLCVGALAKRADLGSAPSISSKLRILSDRGWIQSTRGKSDGRMRHVIPTKKAMDAFQKLSNELGRQLIVVGDLGDQ